MLDKEHQERMSVLRKMQVKSVAHHLQAQPRFLARHSHVLFTDPYIDAAQAPIIATLLHAPIDLEGPLLVGIMLGTACV